MLPAWPSIILIHLSLSSNLSFFFFIMSVLRLLSIIYGELWGVGEKGEGGWKEEELYITQLLLL